MKTSTIFKKYFTNTTFIDRYVKNKENAVDVLIPLMHTNELWVENLKSIFREIPVKNLLIGDGGCIDDSITIVKKYPRVKIFNHKNYISLGYSIKKLIEKVETEWFIYLHSDIYIPAGWFDGMKKYHNKFDWYECRQHLTFLVEYPLDYTKYNRPLSGTQMGRKSAFKEILPEIDDDYLYRNEDLIFANLIERKGYKYGRVDNIWHYHQVMNKKSIWERKIKKVNLELEKNKKEEDRESIMQIKGIIKYLLPDKYNIDSLKLNLEYLIKNDQWNQKEFELWVKRTNKIWITEIKKIYIKMKLKEAAKKIAYWIK